MPAQQTADEALGALREGNSRDVSGMNRQSKSEEEHAHITVAESINRSLWLQRNATGGMFRMVATRDHAGGDVANLPNRPLPKNIGCQLTYLAGIVPTGLPPHVVLRMLRAGTTCDVASGDPAWLMVATQHTAKATTTSPPA